MNTSDSSSRNLDSRLRSVFGNDYTLSPSTGGRMAYHRWLVKTPHGKFFAKAFDPDLLPNEESRRDSMQDLNKEITMYHHFREHGFTNIPVHTELSQDILVLSAFAPEDGWYWDIPGDEALQSQYSKDVSDMLDRLALLPTQKTFKNIHRAAQHHFYVLGIEQIQSDPGIHQKITLKMREKLPLQKAHIRDSHEHLAQNLSTIVAQTKSLHVPALQTQDTLAHHDARISNIAWHPELGARIVDLSWVDPAMPHADTTMFMIDLHKAGHSQHSANMSFNPDYARLQMMYWLAKCTHPAGPSSTVRDHQLFSAVAAYDLLRGRHFA